ncbi:MAG TPA: hypothetical protein VG779_08605 [Actinomycetota bacterium]|nr:hypothetical protein [Actinomycetota bacterium]
MSKKGAGPSAELVKAYVSWARASGAFFDADTVRLLLDYRAEYRDQSLTCWSAEDLSAVLLGLFPAKVVIDGEEVADVVPAVRTFMEFLGSTGRLARASDPLEDLLEELDEIEEVFEEAMGGPDAFGSAKRIALTMMADGVDIDDPEALETWIKGFNARPESERRALIPPPVTALGSPSRISLPPDVPLPMVALLPEEELARAAREAPLMTRLAAFVDWVGSGRKLTDSGRIKLRDIPELVEVLRLGVLPPGFEPRSSSDLPEMDWTYALADAGLLVDVTRRGLITTELGREMRDRPLEAWKSVFEGLFDAGAVTWLRGAKAWQPPWAQMLDDGLPDLLVLSYLGRDQGLLAEEVVELAWNEVPSKARELGPAMRESMARDVRALIGILSDIGVAERSSDRLVLTPLGTWGVNRLLRDEGHDAPAFTDGTDADPASLLAYWGSLDFEGSALGDGVDAWLAGRSPESAVRALADAAGADVRLRGMFLYVLERMGPASADAVRGAGLERDPHLGPYVAAWLAGSGMDDAREPAEEDLARVLADQLAVLLMEGGPDELVKMLDGLGPPSEQAHFLEVLGQMQDADIVGVLHAVATSHPDPVVSRAARKAQLSGQGTEVRGARAAAQAPSSGRRRRAGGKSRKR